jgi:hypothetical protein
MIEPIERRIWLVKTTWHRWTTVLLVFFVLWTVIGSDATRNIVQARSHLDLSRQKIHDPLIQHIARSLVSCVPKHKIHIQDAAITRCIEIVWNTKAISAPIAGAAALPASPWLLGVLKSLIDAVIVAGSGVTVAVSAKIVLIVATVVLIVALLVCLFVPGCIDNIKNNTRGLYQNYIIPTWSRAQQHVPMLSSYVSWDKARQQIDTQLHTLYKQLSLGQKNMRDIVLHHIQEKIKEVPVSIRNLKRTLQEAENKPTQKIGTPKAHLCKTEKLGSIGAVAKEQFILGNVDNRESGLTVCVSAHITDPLLLAQHISTAYYNEVIPFLRNITGLNVNKSMTIYVTKKSLDAAYAIGNSDILLPAVMKWGAKDTINRASTTIENPKNTAVLAHEMVHVLIRQYDKRIEQALDEGVATYVECSYLQTKNYPPEGCYPPHFEAPVQYIARIMKKQDQPLFTHIGSMFHGDCIEKCVAYAYTEKLIRYVFDQLNKQKKRAQYAYIKDMFKIVDMDSWIWDTAVNGYLGKDWSEFIVEFETHLCKSAKSRTTRVHACRRS